ncbi:Serine/threonine-protein kinase [Rhynchospora pubera]|uniref:non-specific serine/threonine protein kinase n=1 Tax=Rhynchospora pubera TaxID=906938 RepID=A0AAV8E737_9POAL|nr:Serine/threonine-protein kinase [Rhynchospora pubera]
MIYLFSVFIFEVDDTGGTVTSSPTKVVWSANRSNPVSENATLLLTSDGGLSLHDSDGTLVWFTNVSDHSVSGINITESGNLVLFDQNKSIIWQSFDHPTDTLLMGQKLTVGASLTANVSLTNWSEGQVHLTVVSNGLRAFADSNHKQLYIDCNILQNITENNSDYQLEFTNGSLSFSNYNDPTGRITLPNARSDSIQFIRLEYNGMLLLYDYINYTRGYPNSVIDLLEILGRIPDGLCIYPKICGHYGIFQDGQCKCADDTYFRQDVNNNTFSCSPVTPISCQDSQNYMLSVSPIDAVTIYNYIDDIETRIRGHDVVECQEFCLQNCSCKAALYSFTNGGCYLSTEIFTLINEQLNFNYFYSSAVYLKVPSPPPSYNEKAGSGPKEVLGFTFGGILVLIFIIGVFLVFLRRGAEKQEQDYIDEVPGMPSRFSLQELEVATQNFGNKLGEGGFGTVFEGSLGDEKVAVKRLEGVEQAKKEFLAEVQIIGNIHHINLVRLIGFCAEKSKRLLVYEYMYNGSLDKWIYGKDGRTRLNWGTRYNIIIDIAKGLCYLHEECRQRIVHLDIKPENILLDENFNAKVADFGLCKLIDRDKSKVMTRMRGTPGYLAPEWLTAMITEKVDVYSFGVVVMEILCGRRNLDYSHQEENRHLITLLEVKS